MAFNDREASYKAIVYFKDGNKRTFYSWDFPHKGSKERKPHLGFARLEKMLLNKFKDTYEAALIYSRQNNAEQARYRDGIKIDRSENLILTHPNYQNERND